MFYRSFSHDVGDRAGLCFLFRTLCMGLMSIIDLNRENHCFASPPTWQCALGHHMRATVFFSQSHAYDEETSCRSRGF